MPYRPFTLGAVSYTHLDLYKRQAAFRGTQFTVDFDVWDNLTYIGAYGFAGMPNLDSFTLSNEIMLGLRLSLIHI